MWAGARSARGAQSVGVACNMRAARERAPSIGAGEEHAMSRARQRGEHAFADSIAPRARGGGGGDGVLEEQVEPPDKRRGRRRPVWRGAREHKSRGGRASAKQPERTTCAPTARACRGKLACPALDVARGNSYATVDASATRREEMKSHVQIELCGDTGCTCARRTCPRESKFGRRHRGNARDRGHRLRDRSSRGGGELAQAWSGA